MKTNEMKKVVLAFMIAVLSLQSAALGQTAFSITDNNQDASNRNQQLYRINIANGDTAYIGDLIGPGGQRIIREYEGFASIGSVIYGVSEFAGLGGGGGVDCNLGNDPIGGLSSDLRTFKVFPSGGAFPTAPSGAQQTVPDGTNPNPVQISLNNGQNASTNLSIQIGETCIGVDDAGTEAAMGYNPVDGFLWSISSDDQFPAAGIRSRLYRISPTTGLAQRVCYLRNEDFAADGGDRFPYIDGMTVVNTGNAFFSDARFSFVGTPPNATASGGIYTLTLPTAPVADPGDEFPDEEVGPCEVTFLKQLFTDAAVPATATGTGQDTGLAHSGANLFILFERGVIYQTNTLAAGPVVFRSAMSTPGAVSGAGGGDSNGFTVGGVAPEGRIQGCRGAVTANALFEEGIAASNGGCRDFEGFDIPVPTGR